MGFNYLRPPIGETQFNSKGILNEVWNKFFTEIIGVEQFKYLEGIVANNISVGDAIASTDYVAGTAGWRIASDEGVGVAEFNISIVSYADISGDKPPANADSTATVIEGGLVTTGTLSVVQGGTVAAGITGNTSGDTSVRFWAGSTFANRTTAPFRVTQAGKAYMTGAVIDSTSTIDGTAASSVLFSGDADLTATVITGGLLTTGRIELQNSSAVTGAGIVGSGSASTDVRFWSGSTYANRATAPFRVTHAGKVYMTGAVIDSTSTLDGTATSTVVSQAADAGSTTTLVNGWKYPTTTYIDGGDIYTGTVTATQLNSALAYTGRLEVVNASLVTGAGMTGGGSASTDVRIWAGDTYANRATAPFRVDHAGNTWIKGKVEVTNTAGVTYAGISGGGSASTDVRFWSGDTYANRATASFRVLNDGKVYINNTLFMETEASGKIYFVDTGNVISGSNVVGVKWLEMKSDTSFIRVSNSLGISVFANGALSPLNLESDDEDVNITAGVDVNINASDDIELNAVDLIYFSASGVVKSIMDISETNFYPNTTNTGTIGTSTKFWDVMYARNYTFPAAANASADDNTLDDYEEGYLTSASANGLLSAGTSGSITCSTVNSLFYVKIGCLVTVTGGITVSAVSSPVGQLRLALPFARTDLTQSADNISGGVTYYNLGSAITDGGSLALSNGSSLSNIQIVEQTTTTFLTDVANHVAANASFNFNFSYICR